MLYIYICYIYIYMLYIYMLNIYNVYIYYMIYVSPLIHIPLDPPKDWVDRRRPLPLPFADPWSRVLADPPWSRWRKL